MGIREYEDELRKDRDLWINVLLVLVLGSESKEDRQRYGVTLLEEADKDEYEEKFKK